MMRVASLTSLHRDERGGVLVEATVMLTIMFIFVLGSVDFLMAMYQWNAASKAVQIGARIAAVSNPVASGLNNLSVAVLGGSLQPGDDMPQYAVVCSGGSGSCACTGTCTGGVGNYDPAAMNTIVFGRGSAGACGASTSFYTSGMCHVFPRVQPANVSITYSHTGLGYAGRPGGPVPTVTVTLQSLNFQFFFLGGLMGFANIPIQPIATVTGEDLSSLGS